MPLIAGKTRDGIVCLFPGGIKEISPLPMCPFPQFDTVDSPFVPTTLPHPTDEHSILACNSQSTERHIFAADGSNGCVYRNADGNDVYIDDIYDCVAIGGYVQSIPNIHIAADGICCPSRGCFCSQFYFNNIICSLYLYPAETGGKTMVSNNTGYQTSLVVQCDYRQL
jgi:hypothetical protein